MTKFFIEVSKIAKKWVTLKVQSKKDESKFYTGYTTKENLFQLDKNATVGTQMYVFADSKDTASGFGHRYEFVLYTETSKENIKGEEEYAHIVKVMQSYISYDSFMQILKDFWNTGNKLHEQEVKSFYKKIKEQESKKWYGYIVENYNNGEGYVYSNGVCKLHELGCHDYDDEIDKMERIVEKRKAEQEEKEEQERAKASAPNPKRFYNINKKIGEVFQDGDDYYKVVKIENFITNSDGIVVTGKEERYANSIEFATDNYEYHYDEEYIVEKISKDEFKTKNDIQNAKKEASLKAKQEKEDANTNLMNSIDEHMNYELIKEKTTYAELSTNAKCIKLRKKFWEYDFLLAENNIIYMINFNDALLNIDKNELNVKVNDYYVRGYRVKNGTRLLEDLKKYFSVIEKDTETAKILENYQKNYKYTCKEELEEVVPSLDKTLEEATRIIKDTLIDIKSSYLQLGSVLSQVNNEKLYKQKYKTFVEYCTTELDMKKSQAYNYIKVYQKFGNYKDELVDYSFTQLSLLAKVEKSVDVILVDYPATLSKRELETQLKNVHPGGQKKARLGGKAKNVSIDADESALLVKALELLHQQDTSIDINNLLKKLKEE